MEFSNRLIGTILNVFQFSDTSNCAPRHYNVGFNMHNVFPYFAKVNMGTHMCIPVFAKGAFEYWTRTMRDTNLEYNELAIPLYTNSNIQSRRTADSIIGDFFRNTRFDERLRKVVTNKGEVYYGNKGCIFDKDMNPLVVACLTCEKLETPENRRPYSYREAILKVHPSVFLQQDTLINKAIIKKIIPIIASRDVHVTNVTGINGFEGKARIEICETKDMFFAPVTPSANSCSNDAINQVLKDNMSEILDSFDSLW